MKKAGLVILAGAGPGDPGLATLNLAKELGRADIVVYDYLANEELLKLAPQAQSLYVGKKAGEHSLSQNEINRVLARLARSGKRVLRLKGGDPFVFGRGGEEALALRKAKIPFEVIPGVSSGIAALAYAGIPLTHRGKATAAVFVTGQEQSGKPLREESLKALARLDATLVFYMATAQAERICASLIRAGRSASTPAALVTRGTLPSQAFLKGTLRSLPGLMRKKGLGAPGLIVVGKVVSLAPLLRWFDQKPLFGRRILVTRAREEASRLGEGLRERGAEVLEAPSIRMEPLRVSPKRLRAIKGARWLILTSKHGADRLHEELLRAELDSRHLAGLRVAAIGASTAERLAEHGIKADLVPKSFLSEGLLEALAKKDRRGLRGARVVLARAAEGRELLPEGLKALGAKLELLPLYRNLANPSDAERLRKKLRDQAVDWVTFSSSSTVKYFEEQLDPETRGLARERLLAFCMGPISAQAAREAGYRVVLSAKRTSIPDFLLALEDYSIAAR